MEVKIARHHSLVRSIDCGTRSPTMTGLAAAAWIFDALARTRQATICPVETLVFEVVVVAVERSCLAAMTLHHLSRREGATESFAEKEG